MAGAVTTLTKLFFVEQVEEDDTGATLSFRGRSQGRLSRDDVNYAAYLRLARRSQERQQPAGVTFADGLQVTELLRADNDVPLAVHDDAHGACVLWQGHDGVFHVRLEHPELGRIRTVLDEACHNHRRIWFVAHRPDLSLVDALLAN